MNTITVPTQGMNFASFAPTIEKRLTALAPILQADASYVSQTVTITYDDARLGEDNARARQGLRIRVRRAP